MSWIATDNFNSYPAGAALAGLNGGSGWGAAWAGGGSGWTIAAAPASGEGGNCLQSIWTEGQPTAHRDISPISSGSVCALMRLTANNVDEVVLNLYEDAQGTGRMFVKFNASGMIQVYNDTGAIYEDMAAYSADTWYRIYFHFDNAKNPGLYRVKVNSGDWTAWKTALDGGSPYANIDRFRLNNEATGVTVFLDSIKRGRNWLFGAHQT